MTAVAEGLKNTAEILGVIVACLAILAGLARGWDIVGQWVHQFFDDRAYRRGTRPIPGVSDGTPPAPLRTKKLEKEMRLFREDLDKVVKAVGSLSDDVGRIDAGQELVLAAIEKQFRNGGTTNFPGDMLGRIADHLGVLEPGHDGHFEDIKTEIEARS